MRLDFRLGNKDHGTSAPRGKAIAGGSHTARKSGSRARTFTAPALFLLVASAFSACVGMAEIIKEPSRFGRSGRSAAR